VRLTRDEGDSATSDAGTLAELTQHLRRELWPEVFRMRGLSPRERWLEAYGDPHFGLPRTQTEMEVVRIVRSVLGVDATAPEEDLEERGLTDRSAVALAARIGAHFSIDVEPGDILHRRSVANIATMLDDRRGPQSATHVVRLRNGGAAAALVFLHPLDGSCLWYFAVADDLRTNVSIWSIGSHGLCRPGPLDSSVALMAVRYVEDLRNVRPHGPYYLCGWSFGGLLAWEMAHLLEKSGEVARALVVDSMNQAILGSPGVATIPAELIIRDMRAAELTSRCVDEAALHRRADVCLANARAAERYVPSPLSTVPVLFRSIHGFVSDGFRHPDRGWLGFCRTGLDIQLVPGSHFALMKSAGSRRQLGAHIDDLLLG